MRKRKILALCDFGNTGISESIRLPLAHLHEQGHEVWQLGLGYNGWSNRIDRKMYPWGDRMLPIFGRSDHDRFGQQAIAEALEVSGAEILVTAFDVWMVQWLAQPEMMPYLTPQTHKAIDHATRKFTHLAYFPIDGAIDGLYLPTAPAQGMEEAIAGFDVPVTYSRFAQEVISRSMNLDVPFIPICHDGDVYKPMNKAEARKEFGLPKDAFVIGMVATNQYRKLWGDFFDAVVPLLRKYPNMYAFPWTTWDMKIMGGSEIRDYAYRSGVDSQIIAPGELVGTFSDEGMAKLYNTFDLLTLCTVGEGAGLPPIRARACGVPALVQDHSSNTEFAGHKLELIPNRGTFYDPLGSNLLRYLPDVQAMTDRIEQLYRNKLLRDEVGGVALAQMAVYRKENVLPKWEKLIEEID